MKIPEWIRILGKQVRVILLPYSDVLTCLGSSAKGTAKELGAHPEVMQRLGALVLETCQESGLAPEPKSQGSGGSRRLAA